MPRRLISTGSPFEKTAGYSRAVVDGDFIFVSGTTGYDYTTMTMPADVTAQAQNCFKTIAGALKEGGFELADIVRIGTFLTDAAEADTVMKVCGAHLGEIRPASTLVVVAALLKPEMKIEIEVTAKRRS
jgi:enamine deaminase RidA (YjgF/YER057c/UK114 family)